MIKKRHNYFEFLLDKTGNVLKSYIEEEDKEPPPWQLCKQMIEKSLAVRMTTSQSQGVTESDLAIYEAQRIWQPLCLAMTLMSHMKWDLEEMQENFPLHLQQILMEDLLRGYGLPMIPQPENFDINKLSKKLAMVHIIYNRWVVKTITKYEELKEKDILPINLSTAVKEAKEFQEQQIFSKLKEYRNLSMDILEKALFLQSDLLIPFPQPCFVTEKEIIPQIHHGEYFKNKEDQQEKNGAVEEEKDVAMAIPTEQKVDPNRNRGILMKVPEILDIEIIAKSTEEIIKICYDLGCYYFPKEMYSDAWRVFQKAFDLIQSSDGELKLAVDYKRLCGFYIACCDMMQEKVPKDLKLQSLVSQLDDDAQNGFKNVVKIFKEDNKKQEMCMNQRFIVEKELYIANNRSQLFPVCVLNFIRCSCERNGNTSFFFKSLASASKEEVAMFFKMCQEYCDSVTSESMVENLKNGIRLAVQYMSEAQRKRLSRNTLYKSLFKGEASPKKKHKREKATDEKMEYGMKGELDGGHFTKDLENDERISKVSQLKAQLTSCFEPDTLKDILFELHETTKQNHAVALELKSYIEIFGDVPDLLMRDTLHIFIRKARQLTSQKHFSRALTMLNICVGILDSYAKRAIPGCSVSRVKNVLHHELLWTELKLAEHSPESANLAETMRRCKACINHSNQDPPPQAHIYKAIIIHLLNNKESQFLVDARANFDITVVDFLQLGYHISSALCGLQRGVEILRNTAKGLWDCLLKIVGEQVDTNQNAVQGPLPQSNPLNCARGPIEEQEMWNLQCFVRKEQLVSLILGIKDDTVLSLLLSCLASMLCLTEMEIECTIKDSYSHLWPPSLESHVSVIKVHVLTVLKPLCDYCLKRNTRNVTWLRTIGDVFILEGNWTEAMKCYLELGSITSSFFTRPVAYSVWDDKVYKNMILSCEKQKAYTQVIVFSQFTESVDYDSAFKAIKQRSSDDATECYYDCLWDVNILEYLIYTHEKRGETEKRKLAVQVIGQPEVNVRCNAEIIQKAQDTRKTRFLQTLSRLYWR